VELIEDEHLATPLHRCTRRHTNDVIGLLGADSRADAFNDAHVGVLTQKRESTVAADAAATVGTQQRGTEGHRSRSLPAPGRPDEQEGVHRRG
jgi:hypothetical protein